MSERPELKNAKVPFTRRFRSPRPDDEVDKLQTKIEKPYEITRLVELSVTRIGRLFDHPDVCPNFTDFSPDASSVAGSNTAAIRKDQATQTSDDESNQTVAAKPSSSKKSSSQRPSRERKRRNAARKLASRKRHRPRKRRTIRKRSSSSPSDRRSRSSSSSKSSTSTRKRNRSRSTPNLSSRPGEYRPDKGRSRYRRSESRSPSTSRHRRRRQSREASPQYRRKQHTSSRSGSGDRPSRQEVHPQENRMPAPGPIPDPTMIAPYPRKDVPPMPHGMPFPPARFMPPRMMQPWEYHPKHLPSYMNYSIPNFNTDRGSETQISENSTVTSNPPIPGIFN